MTRKVVDAFLYNGEEEILDLRIEVLNSVVDEFWIIESNRTFTGQLKHLVFETQSSSQNWPIQKIKYFPYLPSLEEISNNPWENEFAQRNYLSKIIDTCSQFDLIIFSDVDEIPAPEAVQIAREMGSSNFFGFEMSTHYLKFNFAFVEPSVLATSVCTIGFSKPSLALHSPNDLRVGIRNRSINAEILNNGGWHFSYMMNEDLIKAKIKSFSHQEFNTKQVLDSISIKRTLRNNEDLFFRPGYKWGVVSLKNLPKPVRSNPKKYSKFLVLPFHKRFTYWISALFLKQTT